MASTLYTGAYLSCLLLNFKTSCEMLTPLFNVNIKTIEVEEDIKESTKVQWMNMKSRSVLQTAISFVVLTTGHQALVGLTAGRHFSRLAGSHTKMYKWWNILKFSREQTWKDLACLNKTIALNL